MRASILRRGFPEEFNDCWHPWVYFACMNIVAHSMQSVKWGRAFPGSFGFWRPDIVSFCLSVFSPSSLLYQPTRLSIYLSIHLCVGIYQLTGLSIYLPIYLSIWLSVYLSVCLSIHPFTYLSLSLPLSLSGLMSICLTLVPSTSVCICRFMYICLSLLSTCLSS